MVVCLGTGVGQGSATSWTGHIGGGKIGRVRQAPRVWPFFIDQAPRWLAGEPVGGGDCCCRDDEH